MLDSQHLQFAFVTFPRPLRSDIGTLPLSPIQSFDVFVALIDGVGHGSIISSKHQDAADRLTVSRIGVEGAAERIKLDTKVLNRRFGITQLVGTAVPADPCLS